MVTARIDTLIDKYDTRELIRDRLAAILVAESRSQVELALAAGRDPRLWALRVFTERADPWCAFRDEGELQPPVVNVWFENSSPELEASNVIDRQKVAGTFHIDCYGYGVATATPEGHMPADELAIREASRAARLTRNILMAAHWVYLGFPTSAQLAAETPRPAQLFQPVLSRMVSSETAFQPLQGDQPVERCAGFRIDFNVIYHEFSPQHTPSTLEQIDAAFLRGPSGEWLSALYEYT